MRPSYTLAYASNCSFLYSYYILQYTLIAASQYYSTLAIVSKAGTEYYGL